MMLVFAAAAASAAWRCDATFVVDNRHDDAEHQVLTIEMSDIQRAKHRKPFSLKGTAGRSLNAIWVQDNAVMHLVERGRDRRARLVIEQPLTDGHFAHAEGTCRFRERRA